EFLRPSLRPSKLWLYVVRTSILRALRVELDRLHGTVLDVGCGHQAYRELLLSAKAVEYVGLDLGLPEFPPPDLVWDGSSIPLPERSVDAALVMEVLEHCEEPGAVVAETFRVLRPGASLFVTVPFLWPIHGVPHDEYRYTPSSLRRMLERAGFVEVRLDALGAWHAALAQTIALWTQFGVTPGLLRKLLKGFAIPLVALLYRIDRRPENIESLDNLMITGITATARRPS
ncbi:MAG: class I SAM-dependent methyltransferase, partial [Candidatus Binatia bacterium]